MQFKHNVIQVKIMAERENGRENIIPDLLNVLIEYK
jgi:hypothetical protein